MAKLTMTRQQMKDFMRNLPEEDGILTGLNTAYEILMQHADAWDAQDMETRGDAIRFAAAEIVDTMFHRNTYERNKAVA